MARTDYTAACFMASAAELSFNIRKTSNVVVSISPLDTETQENNAHN